MTEMRDNASSNEPKIPAGPKTLDEFLKQYEDYKRGEIADIGSRLLSWDDLNQFDDWELMLMDEIHEKIRRDKLDRLERRRIAQERKRERWRRVVSRWQPSTP